MPPEAKVKPKLEANAIPAVATTNVDEPLPLEERATFLVHRINAKLAQICNPVFAEYDIDLYSSRILVALAQYRQLKVGALVDLMALPQSTISHQLKRLEKIGYVSRTRSLADNRSVEITLTEEGEKAAAICDRLSRLVYAPVMEGFSEEEIVKLRDLLNRMFANLPSSDDLVI